MTIKSGDEMPERPIEIDLSGPEGNAFVLMGYASKWLKQMGRNPKPILDDMRSGNYEHLLEVFEKEFGEFVTLYR